MDDRLSLLEAVFEHSPIGKALVSPDGRFIAVNPSLGTMLGYTADELRRLTFQEITHPDDLQADLELLGELSRGERDHYRLTKRYIHRSNHLVWAQLDVSMVSDPSGQPEFYIAQIQDITSRLQEQRRLRDLHDRLDLALNATWEGIWDWNLITSELNVSRQWQMLSDIHDLDVTWRRWLRQVHPGDRPQVLGQFRAHLAGQRDHIALQYRHLRPGGHWRWFSLRGRVTQTNGTGPARLTGTLSDVDDVVRAQQDLTVLLDHLPAMIGYWDHTLHNRFGNHTYRAWFGKHAALMPGRHISEVLDPRTYELNRPMMDRVLAGEEQRFEREIRGPDGVLRHTRLHYIPDRRGEDVIGFFALGIDITDLREAERALFAEKELGRITLMSIGDSVITTDEAGKVTFLNPVAQHLTGWALDAAIGQDIETVMPLFQEATGEPLLNPLRVALRERRTTGMANGAGLLSRTGQRYSVEDSAAPILADDSTLQGAVIVFHDVTEKRALADRMTYLAQHDALTDLPNRTLLNDRIRHMVQLCQRQQSTFSLAFLDLDGFKHVNDSLGHDAGDELLRQVAARLQGQIRASDTLSRLGGDEFVLLLPEPIDLEGTDVVITRVMSALRAPFQVGPEEVRITGSLGLVLYPQDGLTPDDLMKHADAAMYRAKAEGRNRVCLFNSSVAAEQVERHRLTQAVQQAVALEQFHLVYQPKVDGRSGQITGVEALLRWNRDGQPIGPNVFIPVAEQAGVMAALGTWVLRRACLQGRAWLDAGQAVPVAVNVSAVQFREQTFVRTVQDVLDRTGLPADLLELEVTEGVLMQDIGHVHAVLTELQQLGVRVAIDDFGTGYSSLSYLHTLPINTLKIDRSFVNGALKSPQCEALLRSIVGLGDALKLHLVAEGVETEGERQHLLLAGCVHMQGFLFARPVPAETVSSLIVDRGFAPRNGCFPAERW